MNEQIRIYQFHLSLHYLVPNIKTSIAPILYCQIATYLRSTSNHGPWFSTIYQKESQSPVKIQMSLLSQGLIMLPCLKVALIYSFTIFIKCLLCVRHCCQVVEGTKRMLCRLPELTSVIKCQWVINHAKVRVSNRRRTSNNLFHGLYQ